MRAARLALLLLLAACAARAQLTPIPWHPKIEGPAPTFAHPAKGKKAQKAPPAKAAPAPKPAGPPKYHMTFDTMTTLSPGVYVAEGEVRFESDDMLLTADLSDDWKDRAFYRDENTATMQLLRSEFGQNTH